jgi:hypothetical protein
MSPLTQTDTLEAIPFADVVSDGTLYGTRIVTPEGEYRLAAAEIDLETSDRGFGRMVGKYDLVIRIPLSHLKAEQRVERITE